MTWDNDRTAQRRRDLITFDMFVDCDCNAAEAARQLGVNPSTVRRRVRRHSLAIGKPLAERPDLKERFWSKVDFGGECWEWTASKVPAGYGHFNLSKPRRWIGAHRFAYELLIGPIPDGLTLDHLCRNRACVNPAHLEPVTIGENVLRGNSVPAQNARKTNCKNGHPLSGDNLLNQVDGSRECRTCRNARRRWLWHERQRVRRLQQS